MIKLSGLIKQLDWYLFAVMIILISIGLIGIFSTTYNDEVQDFSNFTIQIVATVIGIICIVLITILDYKVLKNYAYYLYIFANLLLIGVLFFGKTIRGTRGWFDFGIVQFQPSELMKIAIIIILAKYFASISGKPSRFQFIVVSGIITGIPCVLLMSQPDLGSTIVIFSIWLGMLLLSGIKKSYIAFLVLGGGVFSVVFWNFLIKDYQKARITGFLNPALDPLGEGYNLIQSKIAVGSGGLFGRGLGQGTQSQLKFLPEQHTDFIFAVITEELGFIGCFILIALFGFLFVRIIGIAKKSRDDFGLMLVIGSIFYLIIQTFINIGMNIGIMPIIGVALPLLSYGGSSLISILIVFGIIQSVKVNSRGISFT